MVSGRSEKERLTKKWMVLADFKVFYGTLRYRRLWCVSFLTICFEGDKKKNCHLIWGTKGCNIISNNAYVYVTSTQCVLLYVGVIDAYIAFLTSFETGEVTASCLYSFNHWNTINLRHFWVIIQTINVIITSTDTLFFSPSWTSYLKENDVAGFRYENFVSEGSGARYTICQKLCVFQVIEYMW